jgi:uncharacterized membrane protein
MLVALAMLVALIYGTVDQMRPASVVEFIRQLALKARLAEEPLLARTRPVPSGSDPGIPVGATQTGYVTGIDLDVLSGVLGTLPPEAEIILDIQLGSHLTHGDPVLRVTGATADQIHGATAKLLAAVALDRLRDADSEPGYAWTNWPTSPGPPPRARCTARRPR